MRFISIIIISLFCTNIFAEVSIETHLKTSALVKYSKKTWYKNSSSCYPFGAPGDSTDIISESYAESNSGNSLYNKSANIEYTVAKDYLFNLTASKLNLSYKETETAHNSIVNLDMNLALYPSHQVELDSSGCLRVDGLARVQDPTVEGHIVVSYKVPNNVWLVKVKYQNFSNIFSIDSLGEIENTINKSYSLKKTEKFIWVKPGAVIKQKIYIPAQSKDAGDLGKATISFETAKLGYYKNLILKINDDNESFKDHIFNSRFIESTATLINNPDILKSILNTINLNQSISLSNKFFKMANMNVGGDDKAFLKKTLSAILAFEISKHLLKNFEKYCKEIEIYDKDLKKKVNKQGFVIAYYWLHRALIRIENYNLLGVKNFLNKLQQLSNENKTYYDVMSNDELRLKLKKAYELLVETTNADTTPFSAALFDLKLVLKNFGSFTKINSSEDELFTAMNILAEKEDLFWLVFDQDIRVFNKSEKDIINVQSSAIILDEMSDLNQKVLKLLKNRTHFLDIVDNHSTYSFISEIQRLLAHQVNIFDEDVDVEYFDNIRSQYQLENGIKPLKAKIQSCILGDK